METEQAAGLIERAVDAIVEHRDIPSPAMDERLALYRAAGEGEEAFQQWREGRELTLDSFKAALSAAVNADNAPLLGALLDELAASPMIQSEGRREVHYHCCELIRNAARNGKIAALDALIIQAEVFNHREEPYAATGTAAFYLLKDNEHDAARQLFERCLELGVALDISSNIYFDMFKEKQFESAKVLFDYLDGAHIVDKVPSHSSHHLIVTLLNGGHAESAAVVAETMRVHDLTRALVSLATDSGEDGRPAGEYLESALFLLERIYERGGPYDLSRAVNKAAQFGRYELLDTILNFTHEHGIQVDFDEALRYINAPRSAIIIDISGLNLSHEQIFDKVEEELDREGSMPEDRRLIVSRLRRGQIEQERTGEPEQPEIGHAQREAARTELLRDDWEVNYGLPRKDFPVGLGLAMQDILRSLDVPVRRLEADSITLESVEDLEYIRAQLRGQARCPQSGSGE